MNYASEISTLSHMNTVRPLLLPQEEHSTRKLVESALLVVLGIAVLTLSAKLSVPMWPIPFTMQTFAVLVLGAAYGSRLGLVAAAGYLGLGALGLPLFAAGGGLKYLTMPTGGYLIGFLPAVYIAGLMGEKGLDRRFASAITGFALAHALIFVFGLAWLQCFVGFTESFSIGLYPFILGAAIKTGAATGVMLLLWHFKKGSAQGNSGAALPR
jgi:biotin transport system substrate-specific component